ncbi:MAG: cupin domain-containing protein [Rubrobacter sp.]|nr:cupin domain-containing protein [Rubrobacter sp.]
MLLGGEGERLAAARVVLPPGGGMPEHDHGESEALVVCQGGEVLLRSGEQEEILDEGKMSLIAVGDKVSVENTSATEPATLLAFFAPPEFVATLGSWPVAEGAS